MSEAMRNWKGNSLDAIIGKLIFKSYLYCVWTERNLRVFQSKTNEKFVTEERVITIVKT